MQIDQETGRLSNLMLRMIPFLYEFLREYVVQNVKISIHTLCERRKNALWLVREKLEKQEKELLTHLDRVFSGGYKDQALSFYILYHCCSYAGKTGRTGDSVRHAGMMAELEQIKEVRNLRNETAHEMVNVTEKRFHEAVGIGSQEAMGCFCRMLVLIYGDKVRAMRSVYRDLNAWVEQALEVHA